jgi:DNA polymerase-3 subunit gamma/tau
VRENDRKNALDSNRPYAVMARRYRPQNFDALIGQEFLVNVLTNAFARNQIPHAMLLTGVRGVGKTTTARIVAKGLNCANAEGPTISPCGACSTCRAVADSRHVDVLEMDAASRTGIDDIREIIDSVPYRAAEARYKVYIIDEVHMLSKSAFNGLLKTLEEPPSHVVFILATTEIEKVPVTVLSRCMRFDLKRVESSTLVTHLAKICAQEGVSATPDALGVIARAAEGSVRDALSLLDQTVTHAGDEGLTEASTRSMLGMADRGAVFALFDMVMRGDAANALSKLNAMHAAGAEAMTIIRDLGEVCHLATMVKTLPGRADAPELSDAERTAAQAAAGAYGIRELGRLWQMILKALDEFKSAPSTLSAAEMAIIRMTHISTLPTPGDLAKQLAEGESIAAPTAPISSQGSPSQGETRAYSIAPTAQAGSAARQLAAEASAPAAKISVCAAPEDFDSLVALLRQKRDVNLQMQVECYVRPGPLKPGAFEFTPTADAPPELAAALSRKLHAWTGQRWIVSVADGHAAPTMMEKRAADVDALRASAMAHPLVAAAQSAFPGTEIIEVRRIEAGPNAAIADEDDMFESADNAI